MSVWMEVGSVRISEKGTFHVCCGGNGAGPDFRNSELGLASFHETSSALSVLEGIGHAWFPKRAVIHDRNWVSPVCIQSDIPCPVGWKLGISGSPNNRSCMSVLMENGHVRIDRP